MIYENFILELCFETFHFGIGIVLCCGDKKMKYGLLSNHLFQRKQEDGSWREPQDNDKRL